MALASNLAALPIIAGLMAGTGAMAAYVVAPSSAPAVPAPVQAAAPVTSCEQQTWPYIDSRCATNGAQGERNVRIVMAPRSGEAVTEIPAPAKAVAAATQDMLLTRDTVGRPTVNPATLTPVPREATAKRSDKRRARVERRVSREAYQVPSDGYRQVKPVIVVRPLRLNTVNQ
jgi:hypothetical protein